MHIVHAFIMDIVIYHLLVSLFLENNFRHRGLTNMRDMGFGAFFTLPALSCADVGQQASSGQDRQFGLVAGDASPIPTFLSSIPYSPTSVLPALPEERRENNA